MSEPSVRTFYLCDRVARWRAGDEQAINELLRAVEKRLERMARQMLRGYPAVRRWAETGDVLNAASMRLLTALRSIMPGSTRDFFGLSALQIRRELLTLAQMAARRKTIGLEREEAEAVVDWRSSEAEDLELWRRFHEEVENLPQDLREAFELFYYHGWTQKQVGEHLGVRAETVHRRYLVPAFATLTVALGGSLPPLKD